MDSKKSIPELFHHTMEHHIEVFHRMKEDKELIGEIQNAAEMILRSLQNDGAIYLCGNGGSAADAQHIATEFVSRFYIERKAMNAEALTVNTSSLTAIGNDYSFEDVFVRQLAAKGHVGDVLIGISTSGKSSNVIKALKYAKSHAIYTVFLTGAKDASLKTDCVICVPSNDTPRI